jgi:type IV fimbrial biogenesis protein FimT
VRFNNGSAAANPIYAAACPVNLRDAFFSTILRDNCISALRNTPLNSQYELAAGTKNVPSLSPPVRRGNRITATGVTAIELLVVMAIIAILLGIAVPSFVGITQSNRVAGEINALSGDMQFARAEAIKEGLPVSICASANGTSCLGANTWNKGWIVFFDPNGNQTVDLGDTVLRKQIPWTSTDTFTADNNTAAFSYSRDGFALALPGTVTWTLHTQPINASASRCVAINIVGRQQVQSPGTGNCT